ncbi:MAG: hypothetical protein FVQ85_11895 [Planctomycetes bacterium]|nr:hypothetical protein [Planctomycetota bacterium]
MLMKKRHLANWEKTNPIQSQSKPIYRGVASGEDGTKPIYRGLISGEDGSKPKNAAAFGRYRPAILFACAFLRF